MYFIFCQRHRQLPRRRANQFFKYLDREGFTQIVLGRFAVHLAYCSRSYAACRECYAPRLRVLSYPENRKKARNRPKKENEQSRNTPNSGARFFAATYRPEFGVLRL